jgi:endonuclease-3 related protein
MTNKIEWLNQRLYSMYGKQGWWPTTVKAGEPPVYHVGKEGCPVSDDKAFEIIVGAVLTQNTSWSNAERAIINLSAEGLLDVKNISQADDRLEKAIIPARYYNQKAQRLRGIANHIHNFGGITPLQKYDTNALRKLLLSWKGIGKETADSILCYAFNRPIFVVDAYTQRLFKGMGLPSNSYDVMQNRVHESIPPSSAVYGDLHARIVKVFAMKESEKLFADKSAGLILI